MSHVWLFLKEKRKKSDSDKKYIQKKRKKENELQAWLMG
jgi:hypothetical protein